jgi:hypothetical protein
MPEFFIPDQGIAVTESAKENECAPPLRSLRHEHPGKENKNLPGLNTK